MGTQRITRLSNSNFNEQIAHAKLVLFYPWTPYRNAFLSYIVEDSDRELLYYQLTDGDETLAAMLAHLSERLDEISNNLRAVLDQQDPSAWGEALAADINAYTDGRPAWFFLDECDRLPHDDALRQFVVGLVDTLESNVKTVVSARTLKLQPWYDYIAAGQAVVFGTERRAHDVMFTVLDEPKPPLEVYALGRGYALASGGEIESWDGALPRNLFFFFMDNPLVTRDEIFEMFWPKLNTKEATNVFHVTKRKISERITLQIDEPGNFELTQYSTGFYRPSDKLQRYYDVEEFEEAIAEAMASLDEDEEEQLLLRAIDLYKGPFLQDGTMSWMEQRREELRGKYALALIGMGRLAARREDYMVALGYYIRALKETPEREDIHRDVMQIYIKQGMADDARNQYQMLSDILDKNFSIGPSRESRELFETIGG